MMVITTSLTGLGLFIVHPLLPLLLTYDVYLLLDSLRVLNQTCENLFLDGTKRHIFMNRLNFLGYYREATNMRINLRNVTYVGEYENESLNMKHYGLLPSLAKLLKYYSDYDKEPDSD